jgi:hypothetical protein
MSVRYGFGVCENEQLLGRDDYIKKWREVYVKEKPFDSIEDYADIIESIILFDYYCYISIVREVYAVTWTAEPKESKYMKWEYLI